MGEKILVEGLNVLNVQMVPVPVGVTIDFPELMILDVEGIPFTKVGMEPQATIAALAEAFEAYSYPGNYAPAQGIKDTWAMAECVGIQTFPPGTNTNIIIATMAGRLLTCGQANPEWLYPFELEINPATGHTWWEDHVYSTATGCYSVWTLGEILTAYLAEPIVMDRMRGINITVKGKPGGQIANYIVNWRDTVMTENYLWYEPTFDAAMPPPAFRGGGTIKATLDWPEYEFLECEIGATAVFGRGYYYPGIYDGRFQINFYPASLGREYMTIAGDFKIKNLARVTGTGTV